MSARAKDLSFSAGSVEAYVGMTFYSSQLSLFTNAK